jgi:bifunctional DNA-binding transcriptional regulator/antitoxin component of YhaV-PrlF toxin-antitoxin module
VPSLPEDTVYGIGRIDASGRIADRTVTSALGWSGGDRLPLTAEAGVVTARRDPGGMITLPARAYIAIPAALRRRCGLRPGDRVLLAADSSADTLTAYSLAVVDQAIRAHDASQHLQEGISVMMSSRDCGDLRWRNRAVDPVVAQQGPQDIDQAPGKGE